MWMSDAFAEMMLGHLVCLVQGNAFILVEWAYLGRGKLRWPVLWAELLCMGQLGLSLATGMSFFNVQSVLLNVLYLFVTAQLFGGTMTDKLTACLINGTMCLLVENTVNYTYSWFTGVRTGEAWQHPGCLITLCAANFIVGAAVAHFLYSWNQKRALQPLQALVMSFFPGVAVVLNIVLMVTGTRQPATLVTMLLTFGMSVAVLVHIAIVQMFNDQVVQRQNSRYRAQLEQQRAEALLDSYTEQRRLTHEFTNHIEALTLLLQQGEYEEAKAYLATVTKIIAAHTTIMNTHNPLLDALLSKKYEEATCKGVMLYFDLPDLRAIPLEKTDLVMVVSNLLNNAIDAAAQADPPEVYFRMRKTEEELLLSVRNRVRKDLDLPDGQLPRSTKKEPGHGIGLWNVTDVLRKYQGEYAISCRDKWFRFTCSVPVHRI